MPAMSSITGESAKKCPDQYFNGKANAVRILIWQMCMRMRVLLLMEGVRDAAVLRPRDTFARSTRKST